MAEPRTGWSADLTRSIGSTVRELRRRRDLSGLGLVDALAAIGVRMTRDALNNLEYGRRDAIGVHEVYALAAVLGVAPIALLVPDYAAEVDVLPPDPNGGMARSTDGTRLALWITGQHLPGAIDLHDDAARTYAASAEPMDSLILHAELARDVQVAARTRKGPDGDRLYMQALRALLDLRRDMAERHGITAPPLPPDLDYIETNIEDWTPTDPKETTK